MVKTSEEIREGYRKRLILPEFPSEAIDFFTKSGTMVARGYERMVIGDRGPYVEFSSNNIIRSEIYVPPDQIWRLNGRCFYREFRTIDESNVKIYYQKALVNYADYKIDMWYISPFELTSKKYPELIKPLEKK